MSSLAIIEMDNRKRSEKMINLSEVQIKQELIRERKKKLYDKLIELEILAKETSSFKEIHKGDYKKIEKQLSILQEIENDFATKIEK